LQPQSLPRQYRKEAPHRHHSQSRLRSCLLHHHLHGFPVLRAELDRTHTRRATQQSINASFLFPLLLSHRLLSRSVLEIPKPVRARPISIGVREGGASLQQVCHRIARSRPKACLDETTSIPILPSNLMLFLNFGCDDAPQCERTPHAPPETP